MSRGSPLSSLPVDPINTVASGAFYVFVTDGRTWNFASLLESERHAPSAVRDGGTDSARFEAGTNPSLWASASGLVGYWSFDGTGSIANNQIAGLRDESGRGNHGTASNANTTGMAFVPGRMGNAVTFDGVDDWVEIGNRSSLNITGAITVEAWFNIGTLTQPAHRMILDFGAPASYISLIHSGGAFPFLSLNIGGAQRLSDSNFRPSINTWHHFVATWDGDRMRVYVDGILRNTSPSFTGVLHTAGIARIGRHTEPGLFFNGLIDEVRIHNRALTEAEIRTIFNATR